MSRLLIFMAFILLGVTDSQGQKHNAPPTILTGADQMNNYLPLLRGATVAIFANQTSMIGHTHLVDTLLKEGIHIKMIFAPEHGFRGQADAGEHVSSQTDPKTGIPIISLYGINSNLPQKIWRE